MRMVLLLYVHAFALIAFFCNANAVQAQQPPIYQTPNILPPSPTAAGLGKYGLIPVSMATGTASIDIPVHVYETKNLKVPISLSYNSNGVKVDEVASWVGMGWSLNAGGVVTRIVRDDPDEMTYSSQVPIPDNFYETSAEVLEFIEYAGNNDAADFEADIFSFNFLGYSGKFIIDKTGLVSVTPHSNILIQRFSPDFGRSYFIITTPDGVKHTFAAAESVSSSGTPIEKAYIQPAETSWYLTSMEHPLGDKINLTYGGTSYTYPSSLSHTITRPIANGTCGGASSTCSANGTNSISLNSLTVSGVRLQKIESEGHGSIVFSATQNRPDLPDFKLDGLLIKDREGITRKEFVLNYTFSNSGMAFTHTYNNFQNLRQRMFLTSLVEKDKAGKTEKKHTFEYEDINGLPPRLSFAQDHWGYFNGADNSDFVPPNTTTRDFTGSFAFAGIGGDRDADSSFTDKGMLKKIIYPTGGSSTFKYEPNTYFGNKVINPAATQFQLTVSGQSSPPPVTNSATLTNPPSQVIQFYASASLVPGYSSSGVGAQLNLYNATTGQTITRSIAVGASISDYFEFSSSNVYTISIIANENAVQAAVSFSYYATPPQITQENIITGGLRVARITNKDAITNIPEETLYFYARHDQLAHSSGMTFGTPVYYTEYVSKQPCQGSGNGGNTCSTYDCTIGTLHSSSKSNLFQTSNNVYYEYVTVSRSQDLSEGLEEHEFRISFDTPAQQVWGNRPMLEVPTTNTAWDNGKEEYVRYYKRVGSNNILIKQIFNSYVKDPRLSSEVRSVVVRKKYQPTCPEPYVVYCNASNINLQLIQEQCVTNHNHWYGSWFPWQAPRCLRFDAQHVDTPVWSHPCFGREVGDTLLLSYALDYLDAMEYKTHIDWVYLDKTIATNYDENGSNPVVSETKFYYDNPRHALVTRSSFTNSDGKEIETRTKYPYDYYEGASPWLQSLRQSYIVNKPIKQETTVSGKQTSGQVVVYNAKGQPTQVYNYEDNQLKAPFAHDTTQIIPSNDYKLKTTINYTALSNTLENIGMNNNIKTTYLWGYHNTLPIAEIKNAASESTSTNYPSVHYAGEEVKWSLFDTNIGNRFQVLTNQNVSPTIVITKIGSNEPPTPFLTLYLKRDGTTIFTHNCSWGTNSVGSIALTPGIYQWSYTSEVSSSGGFSGYDVDITTNYTSQLTGSTVFHTSFEDDGIVHPSARTGSKVWSGTYELVLPGTNGSYQLSYWSKTGSSEWGLVQQTVSVTSGTVQTMTIGGSGSLIDEVRLLPPGALMTTYTYDAAAGITSATDPNHSTSFYEYDNSARLKAVRDNDRNVVNVYMYNYKQQ